MSFIRLGNDTFNSLGRMFHASWLDYIGFEYDLQQFWFLPLCPLSHQSTNNPHLGIWSPETKFSFLSHCQEIHPKVRRKTKLKNKIPIYYSIALKCWNASKLFWRKYGWYWNTMFTWILMWTERVFWGVGGGRPFPRVWPNRAHSAVWFELSFPLAQAKCRSFL